MFQRTTEWKSKKKKRVNYLDFVWQLKKGIEHKNDCGTNYNQCAQNFPQMFGKGTIIVAMVVTNWNYLNYVMTHVDPNTDKCSGDLIRIAIAQNFMNDHQLIVLLVLQLLLLLLLVIIILIMIMIRLHDYTSLFTKHIFLWTVDYLFIY